MRLLISILLFITASISLAVDNYNDNISLGKSNFPRRLKSKSGKRCKSSKSSKSPGKGRAAKYSKEAKSFKGAKSSKGIKVKSSKSPKGGKSSKSSKWPKTPKVNKSSKLPKGGKGGKSSKLSKGGKGIKSSKSPKSGKGRYYDCEDVTPPTPSAVPPPSKNPSTFAPTSDPTISIYACDSLEGRQRDIGAVVDSISGPILSEAQELSLKWLLEEDTNTNACDNNVAITQRFSLGVFYFSTGGDDWKINSNWLESGINECQWHGLDCDGVNVKTLKLGKYSSLPSPKM